MAHISVSIFSYTLLLLLLLLLPRHLNKEGMPSTTVSLFSAHFPLAEDHGSRSMLAIFFSCCGIVAIVSL